MGIHAIDPLSFSRVPSIGREARTPRNDRRAARSPALRFGSRLNVMLVVMMVSCSAALADARYRLIVDDPRWDGDAASAEMIQGGGEDGPVWRHVVPDREQPHRWRVVAIDSGEPIAEGTLKVPTNADAAVVFDPDAKTLAVADGAWHLFRYKPPAPAESVTVAGSFNGWSKDANPMRPIAGGVWRTLVKLPQGVHHYKFVINDNQWVNDPAADPELNDPDNYGGVNSGIFIGLDGRDLPAPQPNAIRTEALKHDPADTADRNIVSETLLRLSMATQSDDVAKINVLAWPVGSGEIKRHALSPQTSKFGFVTWSGLVRTDARAVAYVFEVIDGEATAYLTADGAAAEPGEPFTVAMTPTFVTPDWAKHAVWYQIFPERFRNGEPANDPPHTKRWTSKWFALLPGEKGEFPEDFYTGEGNVWWRKYGGDFQGVMEKLPYLRSLGVNALYFNPIFEGESMHKYDTRDFRHVDDNFGFAGDIDALEGETDDPATWQWTATDRLFLEFIQEAHRQGFKVIIDGVFNHVGKDHPFFLDVKENGRDSKYADWFEITSWDPFHYAAWDGPDGWLPVFKKHPELGLAPGPREHIFAITRRWMDPDGDGDPSDGIDGWRLDVPGDIPHPFWRDWRKLVKSINGDAYISGEIWSWAQPWLRGDQFDAVMNYRFAEVGQDFFVDQDWAISPSQFADRTYELIQAYPFQVVLAQQNLYGSHDTDRLASMFVNPDLPYDGRNRIQDNGPQYDPSKPNARQWTRMKQAVTWQHTFVGAPMTYYGDEAGMWSPDDPSNRQPMIWRDLEPYDNPLKTFKEDLFRHYQRVIAIRNDLEALRVGGYRVIAADDEQSTFVFSRELGEQRVVVAINRRPAERTVRFDWPGDEAAAVFDLMNPAHAEVVEPAENDIDGRPSVRLLDGAEGHALNRGRANIKLGPYETAVLVERGAFDN